MLLNLAQIIYFTCSSPRRNCGEEMSICDFALSIYSFIGSEKYNWIILKYKSVNILINAILSILTI